MSEDWSFAFDVPAYRLHPLGFFYGVKEIEPGVRLRSRVWVDPRQVQVERQEQQAHDHTFDMISRLQLGALRNRVLQFDPHQEGTVQEFEVSYEGASSMIRPTHRIGSLLEMGSFDVKSPMSYSLSAGVIHTAEAIELPCVTFVRTHQKKSVTLSYGADAGERAFERRLAARQELSAIESALEKLR